LGMYGDFPKDAAGLGGLCYVVAENYIDAEGKFVWVEGEAVYNFSKDHKGRRLRDIASTDPGFLSWIIGKDFTPGVKKKAAKALSGEFPQIG